MPKENVFRPTVVVGNWKMYKTVEEALHFVETLTPLIQESQVLVYIAVPFTALGPVSKKVQELSAPIKVGAQNMHDASFGAFTGEIAAPMLKELGAQFVILGHSERRRIFGETDAFIQKKVEKAFQEKLQPLVCIGETLEEREQGRTEEVLNQQIEGCLGNFSDKIFDTLILAYEPVWAIGTGKVAKPEEAESAHSFCREIIAKKWGEDKANRISILYGGSVKPDNASLLLEEPDIDGFLVGGASLDVESFNQIVHAKIKV